MKKINRIIIALLVFLLVFSLSSAFADDGLPYIDDLAGLMSSEDARELNARASAIAEQYGIGTYVVTIPSKADLDVADYDIYEVADMIYDASDFGVGRLYDGVMFLLSHEESEFCVYSYGANAEQIYTPEICEVIEESFIDHLDSSDTWYDLFYNFIYDAEFELEWAKRVESGEDFDYDDYADYDYDYDYDYDAASSNVKSSKTRSTNTSSSSDLTENVMDYAKILSSASCDSLSKKAADLQNKYTITVGEKSSKIGIYIMTLPNKSYINADGFDIESLSEAVYEAWDLGLGDEKTGILLLMDMGEREFDIVAHGTAGHYTFTDYGKDKLEDSFIEDFGENEWADGFNHYLNEIERQLMWAEKGEPVDVHSSSERLREKIGIPGIVGASLLIGLFLAFCICGYFKAQMKSVRPAASAAAFSNDKGIEYSEKVDDFIKTTTVTRTIESSSSKGGTSVNSHGYSHHSGKF